MEKQFYTITGGPGSGKTSLINELKKRGYGCQNEIARQIIKEQILIEGEGVPWKNLDLFKKMMLERFIQSYPSAQNGEILFFDRDILDLIGYDRLTKKESSFELIKAAQTLVYNEKVFVAPPWENIYCTDNERTHSFEWAVKVYDTLVKVYAEYGRKIIELPKVSVEERADFVIAHINPPLI